MGGNAGLFAAAFTLGRPKKRDYQIKKNREPAIRLTVERTKLF